MTLIELNFTEVEEKKKEGTREKKEGRKEGEISLKNYHVLLVFFF